MQWGIVFHDMHIILDSILINNGNPKPEKHYYFPFEEFVGNSAKHFESGTQLRRLKREMILA